MPERSIVLQAVGDIALGDHPLCAGFGTHSRCRTEPPGFPFRHVRALFERADLLFGNLECTLSEHGLRARDYRSVQMRGHAAYLTGLQAAGFDVLNVANNHSMQHGAEPFLETVAMLRGAGVEVCGVAASSVRSAAPAVVERNGLAVAFLGYSLRPRQYFTREPLYAEGDREHILEDVRTARRASDVVVASLHWGDEFIDRPSPREVELAHAVMDAGADLVIGHHPHVLRGIERYGRGYIIYSLGNFVCDMLWDEPLRESAIVQCTLTAEGVSALTVTPIRIADDSCPVPLHGERAAALTRRLDALSNALGHAATKASARDVEEYSVAADLAHRDERRKAHRYFLRKAHRFPPGILLQQVVTWARNRLAERGLVKAVPTESR
ncbi:MAG: CapA family protein [Vicinamibacterales bacterium]